MSSVTSEAETKPIELFVSYSHAAAWLGRLQPFLQFDDSEDSSYA